MLEIIDFVLSLLNCLIGLVFIFKSPKDDNELRRVNLAIKIFCIAAVSSILQTFIGIALKKSSWIIMLDVSTFFVISLVLYYQLKRRRRILIQLELEKAVAFIGFFNFICKTALMLYQEDLVNSVYGDDVLFEEDSSDSDT